MTHHRNFSNESQDARRKDQHNLVHPDDKHQHKSVKTSNKSKPFSNGRKK